MNSTKESLKTLLKNVKTIALVGASPNSKRDSHKVMKYLIKNDYEVFPVNPNEANKKILGRKCFSNLKEIDQEIDMVDIFRSKKFVKEITKDAIKAGVKVIWTQEGIIDKKSAFMAKNKGIKFVMDECPMKVLKN